MDSTGVSELVLQHHNAYVAGEHLDLRIQYPTKRHLLASWAIPRAIIPKKGARILAVKTADHGLKWLKFQGSIPRGVYGGGSVKIVQRCQVEIIKFTNSYIVFKTIGKTGPISGKYSLIRMGQNKNKKQEAWFFMKNEDD